MTTLQHLKISNNIITAANYNALIDALAGGLNGFTFTSPIRYSIAENMVASPLGTQSDAPRLLSEINNITSASLANSSVKLPDALPGLSITVNNKSDKTILVFPYEGSTVDGGSINAPVPLIAGETMVFDCITHFDWETNNSNGTATVPLVIPQLSQLTDVVFVTGGPIDGQTLVYNGVDHKWEASSVSANSNSPSAYNLGAAATFVALTGGTTTVSNGGLIIPTGHIGESTLTGTGNITFQAGSNSGASPAAVSAANTLYNTLLALSPIQTTASTDITSNLGYGVGRFVPGVYKFSNGIAATASQTITLIGDGDYVFICEAAANLGANFSMILTHGAHSSRVFFVSVGAITTGANNILKGTFITTAAINVGATDDIEGRLFSTIAAAITLDGTASNLYLPS